jgi:hypothetical protein
VTTLILDTDDLPTLATMADIVLRPNTEQVAA